MPKYYSIPKKLLNPRTVHLYDVAAVALMLAAALTVMPLGTTLDLSAGFNEKSEAYLAEENQDLNAEFENTKISRSYLTSCFETTTIQNGGTVYRMGENAYYFYQDGDQGYTYYPIRFGEEKQKKAETSASGDLTRGLIDGESYITVGEDGRIYYDNLEGLSGWTDYYVDLDAEVDYAAVANILNRNTNLTLQEAALIWSLVERDILIGYCDQTVWFQKVEEGVVHIYRGSSQGVEEVYAIEGELSHVMTAFNQLLFYVQDGDVNAYSFETGETTYFPVGTKWTELGAVRQLAYVKRSDGTIRLYALNENTSLYADFTGNGVETVDGGHSMNGIDCRNYSEIFTTRGEKNFTIWFQDIGQIVWRNEEEG